MTLNAKRFAPSHEGFWAFGKPHYWNDERNTDFTVWHMPPAKQQHGHTCAFPEKLIQPIIDASSESGDTVLDPFMGSGTTGIVCADMGRKFIGIERDGGYFDAACERLRQAAKQDRLFA
jgi:DNA modification methylase